MGTSHTQGTTSYLLFITSELDSWFVTTKILHSTGTEISNLLWGRPSHKIKADALFMCVDSLAQRKVILKSALDSYARFKKPKVIIDGRMHRLLFRVFTIPLHDQEILNKYRYHPAEITRR